MKSLITGGTGFVGIYLARYLQMLGHEVAVTKMPGEQIFISGVSVYDLNILEKEEVSRLFTKIQPDYIFHLAAQSSVDISWKNPGLTIDVNIKGSTNVLDAFRALENKPRLLLPGSGEEYGCVQSTELPVGEEHVLKPGNIYAVTKVCQNMIGSIYAKAYGLDIVMTRAFNHVGPNQAPFFVLADFCRQTAEIEAGKREPVIRAGNLDVKRDFTDVRDVVCAYVMLAEKGQAGETYNIGSGQARSIREILQTVINKSTAKIQVKVDEKKLRPIDMTEMRADIQKIQKVTGWKPKICLEQSIQDTLDYWRREYLQE